MQAPTVNPLLRPRRALAFALRPGYESGVATPVLEDVQFPLAHCSGCGREVVTYVEIEDDAEIRRCLHCDQRLADWRDVTAAELEAAGYSLLEARGCGNGGGCSSGGCGVRR